MLKNKKIKKKILICWEKPEELKYFSNSETIISRNKINSKNQLEVILLGHFKCNFFKQYAEGGTGKRFSVTVN